MRKPQGDFAVIFAGRVLQALYALALVRCTTAILGATEIGRRNLILSTTSWFALLLISPAGNYMARQAVEWDLEGRLLRSLTRFAAFLVLVATTAAVVLTIVQATMGIGTPIDLRWLIWLVTGSLVVETLNGTFNGLLNTLGFRTWYVLLINLTTWLGLGLSIAFTRWINTTAEHWMNGLLIAQCLVVLLSGWLIVRVARRPSQAVATGSSTPGFEPSSVIGFSWPLVVSTGFYWAQTNGYRFVLANLTDVRTIGLFTTGLSIALSPMAMFDTLFTEYYRPIFYRDIAYSDARQKAEAWNRYARAYFPAVVLASAFMATSGPLLARFLVSAEFQGVSWLAFWGTLVQAALMFYATYSALAFASLHTRVLILPNVLGAAVAIVGTVVSAPLHPLLGPAISLVLAMSATMVDTARRLRRSFALRLPWGRLAQAGLLSLPLVGGLLWAQRVWPTPSTLQAAVSLAGGGLYMAAAQLILARQWMVETRPDSEIPDPPAELSSGASQRR